MTEHEVFEAWANDYGLRAEPNYSKHTEADCWAAWQAARAQPAQAVPMLSDAEIDHLFSEHYGDGGPTAMCEKFARAIEQAVRAKLGVAQWLPISTAPKDCGFLGYQPLTDGMWITAPMYWDGSEFVLLQFHHGNTEPSMSPTHWMQLPEPPNGTN